MSHRTGPPPTPTKLRLLRGNPGHRPLNDREPKPKLEIPTCPSHLEPEARKEWKRIAKELYSLGLLTKIDRAALAAYCQCWGRWVEAEEQLKKTGLVVKSPAGYPILSPYLSIANKAMKQMQMLLSEFGCSPASRSRIHAQPTEHDDEEKQKERRFFR